MQKTREFLIIGFATLALTGTAFGAADTKEERGVEVFAEPVMNDADRISAAFQISRSNPELGNSWVEISIHAPPPGARDSAGEARIIKKHIPGLKYDFGKREIVLDQNGHSPIVCAKLVKRSFLFITRDAIETTGNCNLSASLAPGTQDDGFEISRTVVGKVVLTVSDGK